MPNRGRQTSKAKKPSQEPGAGIRQSLTDELIFHHALGCLVAIDLKVGEFEPANAGQMQFYLNYLAENVTREDENPPVGASMCAGKDTGIVRYSTAGIAETLFVSRYQLELPSEEQFLAWLREEKDLMGSAG